MFKIDIPEKVNYIIDKLMKNGYEAYIVGGCVRDSILKRQPNDWDITTDAEPDKVASLFEKVILTGIKHGTVTVVIDKENYEVTTYRTDGEYEDNRHPKQVEFVKNLQEDLARRDFTINAMAYNESNGLVDYFDGISDLNNKVIRTVGEAEKRFSEDALRMLRAIRFSAQLDFKIDMEVLESIKSLKDNIRNISSERIREEFNKILLSNPRKIDILRECGLLQYIMPELNDTYGYIQNNPYHVFDLYEHSILSAEVIEDSLHLKLAMIMHDLGKPESRNTDEEGISHYYKHAEYSAHIADKVLKRFKYDNETINKTITLIKCHDCTLKSRISIKRMLNKIGEDLIYDLIRVKWADILSQNPLYAKERILNLIEVENKLNSILAEKECFNLKQLKLNGKDLIAIGFNKGREIGEILNYLLEIVIKEPHFNDRESLLKLADERFNKGNNIDCQKQ